jgi:hypothetical protein
VLAPRPRRRQSEYARTYNFNMHGMGPPACERAREMMHLSISTSEQQQTTRQTPPSLKTSAERASDGVSQNREEYKNDDAAGTLTEYVIKLVSRAAISPQHPFPVCIRPSLCPYFNNRRSHFFRSSWLPACVSRVREY